MEEQPFPTLKIDSAEFLDGLTGRSKCSKCRRSRKYYCYTCFIPVEEIADKVPKLKLPIKVDIIKHPSECDGKSTAIHAGVICPEDVTIFTYPCIPDYSKETTLLVFPSESSVTLEDLASKLDIDKQPASKVSPSELNDRSGQNKTDVQNSEFTVNESRELSDSGENSHVTGLSSVSQSESVETDEKSELVDRQELVKVTAGESVKTISTGAVCETNGKDAANGDEKGSENLKITDKRSESVTKALPYDKVVFIDSTWNQTKSICNDERLKGLTRIELKTRKTKFWRHQEDVPDTYLSTIEAIYYFIKDFHENFIRTDYHGQYDNLLFFFTFMYNKIRTIYDGGEELRAYKKRKVTQN